MSSCIYTTNKYQQKYIEKIAISNPTIVLFGEYQTAHLKTLHLCLVCGYKWNPRPKHIVGGSGCPSCSDSVEWGYDRYISHLKKNNPNIRILEPFAEKTLYLKHGCKICYFEWIPRRDSILGGGGCPQCSAKTRGFKSRKTHKEYVDELKEINNSIYPIEHYQTSHIKILHQCKICEYKWKVLPSNTYKGQGCPECANGIQTSKGEKEVVVFIKEIYNGLVVENDRTILKPKELDVYLPDIGFAVEYNGNHWHRNKPKGYHTDKTSRCLEQGIKLLHIWESDWKADEDLWKYNIQKLIYGVI